MKYFLILLIGINFGFIQDSVPPQGRFSYELYFSEWNGRMPNTSIDVIIKGNRIKIIKNEDTNIGGDNLIAEGILMKHDSGKWIIGNSDSDKSTLEIGGCSGGPIPIDFNKKIIEWC